MERILVCPFCDMPAKKKKNYESIMLPHKIYTPMICEMGHEFYSVEEIPEDQSALVKEIREIKSDAIKWKKQLRNLKK